MELNPYVKDIFAFKGEDFELLNYQQDLGLQGLKTCKKGFHPYTYLRKYRVAWIGK